MTLAIVKYNAGNIQSVLFALERLGVAAVVTDDHDTIRTADRVIFPGVGEASTAMAYLREHSLDSLIAGLEQPVLGICLGMQLLCTHSEENDTPCLGVIPVAIRKFPGGGIKIPQIGWNNIYDLHSSLFNGIEENAYVYHVHSYYAEDGNYSIAKSDYGIQYASAIRKNNFYGVQFHTEKSASVGETILKNFLSI